MKFIFTQNDVIAISKKTYNYLNKFRDEIRFGNKREKMLPYHEIIDDDSDDFHYKKKESSCWAIDLLNKLEEYERSY